MSTQTSLYRYRVWCENDNTYKYVWSTSEPSNCPENAGHSITSSKTSIIQTLKSYQIDNNDSPYRYRKYQLVVDTSGGNVEVVLKQAVRVNWDFVIVKTSTSNNLTLSPFAGDTIDSGTNKIISDQEALVISRDPGSSTNWVTSVDSFNNLAIPEPIRWDNLAHGKGDLLVDNGEDLVVLEVGQNGEYLQVQSSEETGVHWQNLYTETGVFENKTLIDSTTTVANSSDNTKKVRFDLSNLTTSQTRVLSFPDNNGTITTTDATQILTNKQITMGGTLNINGQSITNVPDPVGSGDAANKGYVDNVASGLAIKEPVLVATTSDGTLASSFANGQTVDGVTLVTGDRILIKDQSTPTENGIYIVNASGAPTRASDFAISNQVGGSLVFVQKGTLNGDNGWVCTSDKGNDTVGTNGLAFSQFSGAGQIVTGSGLSKSGNEVSVDPKADGGIVFESGQLAVDLAASSITGVLNVNGGGTGKTSLDSGYFLTGNGTSAVLTTVAVPNSSVVGTTTAQTLTLKNIDADQNTITNISNSSVKTGAAIDVTKVGNGTVNNTKFGYLSSLDGDIATKFSGYVPYSETNLVTLENSSVGSANHVKFQVTKSHSGADTYNLGVDANPVKLLATSESGTNRQAVVISDADVTDKTVFGVATSTDSGSTWNPRLTVLQGGQVGVGVNNPSNTLEVDGTASITSNLSIGGNVTVNGTVDGRDIATDGGNLDSHMAASSGVHGVTGSLVGTSGAQTLTQKTFGDNLDLGGNKIINLATPTNDGDAASKSYVDNVASGLAVKESVVAASNGSNITLTNLSNGATLDGVTLATGDRVLLKNQTDTTENGIYIIAVSGAPSRASDFNTGDGVGGTFVFVQQGTTSADSGWVCTTDGPDDIVGTNNLSFSQFSGAGSISTGDGLQKSGNVLSADLKANGGLSIESGKIAVDLGATNLSGNLGVVSGGTGATTFTANYFIQGNGTGALSSTKAVPSGDVVGTTDSQTLIGKTISANNNTITDLTSSDVGLGNVANTKNNYAATTNPSTSDDSGQGYTVGSVWVNTSNGNVYQATSVATGAAVWTQLNRQFSSSDMIEISRGNDNFYAVKSSTYASVRNIIFRGTGSVTPTAIKLMIKIDNAATTAKVKIVDITNNQDIGEATALGTANTMTIESLGTLSNLSSSEAVWEIQLCGSNATNYTYLYNVAIYY